MYKLCPVQAKCLERDESSDEAAFSNEDGTDEVVIRGRPTRQDGDDHSEQPRLASASSPRVRPTQRAAPGNSGDMCGEEHVDGVGDGEASYAPPFRASWPMPG